MTITPIRGKANANIILDGSKSESNRALMIKYYGALSSEIDNLSHSADTMLLNNLLALVDKKHDCVTVIDCANAGCSLAGQGNQNLENLNDRIRLRDAYAMPRHSVHLRDSCPAFQSHHQK